MRRLSNAHLSGAHLSVGAVCNRAECLVLLGYVGQDRLILTSAGSILNFPVLPGYVGQDRLILTSSGFPVPELF